MASKCRMAIWHAYQNLDFLPFLLPEPRNSDSRDLERGREFVCLISSHGIENLLLQRPHLQQQGHSWFHHQWIYWNMFVTIQKPICRRNFTAMLYCIYVYFTFCILWYFVILKKLSGWGETVPPGVSQCLEKGKDSAGSIPLICKLFQSQTSSVGHTSQKTIFFWLNYPRVRYQAARDHH